jgi:hypothetical protein
MQAGVTGDDLPGTARCRVTVKDALDIGAQAGKHGGLFLEYGNAV